MRDPPEVIFFGQTVPCVRQIVKYEKSSLQYDIRIARIGRGGVVGAGSVITEGKELPELSLIIGSPARVIRTLSPEQADAMGRAAKSYAINGPRFKIGRKKIG